MSEDPTKDLRFQERVLVELGAIRGDIAALDSRLTTLDSRLTTLEERVDARLHETRPIWEAIQLSIEKLDEKFDNVIRDLYGVRADVGLHEKRLREAERRLNT
jgi:predicted  nucleic acid-binding Zn-ribbon protein